ncbi:ribonuclease D [Alphaproteobacteria bacterium]|nr:ribonuclease D [Alphaproteobacteria bacterium]
MSKQRTETNNDSISADGIKPIFTTDALIAVVERFRSASFLAVDTEFMRERTYYPQLCLIQISDGELAVGIDPLADGIDISPLWELMRDPAIVKVFHAAHQDMEIFLHLMGDLPAPIYDSQIGAMVMGQGDQVGYDRLVKAMLDHDIDKTSRFTDWSKRPLTDRQMSYALDDVIYLAKIYPMMIAELETKNRTEWLAEENAKLADINTYRTLPEDAWKRIKIRHMKPAPLLRLIHLAAWREQESQQRDIPRNRILRDETLIDLAGTNPRKLADFSKIRNFPGGKEGKLTTPILRVLEQVAALPDSALPETQPRQLPKRPPVAVMELLRVLLKHITDEHGVAPRLIASADDLERLALDDDAPIKAMSGWRRDLFGEPALKLINGKIALAVDQRQIKLIEL